MIDVWLRRLVAAIRKTYAATRPTHTAMPGSHFEMADSTRRRKRRRTTAEDRTSVAPSCSSSSSSRVTMLPTPHSANSSPCLLHMLQPIRHCLQPFIGAKDAFCLMRAGRSTTAALLAGYGIFDIEHASKYGRRSPADVKRSIALFVRYGMRILAMQLPKVWDEPLLDAASGESVLPASLVALTLGTSLFLTWVRFSSVLTALFSGTSAYERLVDEWRRTDAYERRRAKIHPEQFFQLVHSLGATIDLDVWSVRTYLTTLAPFNQPISPGALPQGLRFLQLNDKFNQPLQRGSIPDTVELLQFGSLFNQPLDVGHLPPALVQLKFGSCFDQPLLPGVLPAGLKRLSFDVRYSHCLLPGVLPSQLEELYLADLYNHPLAPGVIPASVRYLSLGGRFNQPLQPGSIPEGVYHLDLGEHAFNQPLPPGVLPSSLRQLRISQHFNQPLHPGSLPDGLELLQFVVDSDFSFPLLPGVIPASVIAISMGGRYKQELVVGSIPASVQWLRLPAKYRSTDPASILSPSTRVVWHAD